jgi:hypothetical protein
MKMKISWYQECLKNSTDSVSRDLESNLSRFAWIMRNKFDNDFRKVQIEEAIRQGKDGFDSDKFMKNARLKAKEDAEQRITAQVCQLKAASIH